MMVMLVALASRGGERRIPSALLWLASLWGVMMNVVRVAFYDRHLPGGGCAS